MFSVVQSGLQLSATPYTFARLVAWAGAVAVVASLNRRQGISWASTATVVAICIPLSVLGSRLLDALEYASAYPVLSEAIYRNGSSIYGGLALSFLGVWAVATWRGFGVLRFLDAGAPAIALGESLSRVGCFVAGCCYGVPWNGPWAVSYPRGTFAFSDQVARGLLSPDAEHTLPVHPVQLYSVLLAFGICVWLVRSFLRRRTDGEVFYRLLVAYGALRLAMGPLRIESLGSAKLFSVLFIVAGLVGLLRAASRAPQTIRHPAVTS